MHTNCSKIKQINTKQKAPYNMQTSKEKQYKTQRRDKRQVFDIV